MAAIPVLDDEGGCGVDDWICVGVSCSGVGTVGVVSLLILLKKLRKDANLLLCGGARSRVCLAGRVWLPPLGD